MSRLRATCWTSLGSKFATCVIGLVVVVALGADFIASSRPLLLHKNGTTSLFLNISEPIEMNGTNNELLTANLGENDWLITTPIPWGPNQQDKGFHPLDGPSARHLLGTDSARRDVLARLIHGTRLALWVGLTSVALYVVIGVLLGLCGGYFGGWIDGLISRLTEAVMTLPLFFLVLAVMGVLGQSSVGAMVIVIGCVYWTRIARLTRTEVLRVKILPHIEAARSLGFSHKRIMFRHILPNAWGPAGVAATFGVAGIILVEAALSFLGFGAPDASASWGSVLRDAMNNVHAWWLVVFPGLCVFATVASYNILGERLRDELDPKRRSTRYLG